MISVEGLVKWAHGNKRELDKREGPYCQRNFYGLTLVLVKLQVHAC